MQRYSDGFRDGAEFRAATIYYPEAAQPPFAMIVSSTGYLSTQADDASGGPFMALHGMVLMILDTNTIGDSVLQRKAAQLDALESLEGAQTRADSPPEGKLALDRVSLMGRSMGGGGAWRQRHRSPRDQVSCHTDWITRPRAAQNRCTA